MSHKTNKLEKEISRRDFSSLAQMKNRIIKNRCLKRSEIIYRLCRLIGKKEIRINIAMRCRADIKEDWGHAWVTIGDAPIYEPTSKMISQPRTLLADTGKYRYWIYD